MTDQLFIAMFALIQDGYFIHPSLKAARILGDSTTEMR